MADVVSNNWLIGMFGRRTGCLLLADPLPMIAAALAYRRFVTHEIEHNVSRISPGFESFLGVYGGHNERRIKRLDIVLINKQHHNLVFCLISSSSCIIGPAQFATSTHLIVCAVMSMCCQLLCHRRRRLAGQVGE